MNINTLTILTADEGKWLTQASDVSTGDRTYSKSATLAKGDSADNWREADDTEREAHEEAIQAEVTRSMERMRSETP